MALFSPFFFHPCLTLRCDTGVQVGRVRVAEDGQAEMPITWRVKMVEGKSR